MRNRDDVVQGAEIAHPAHHLDAERDRPALALESLPKRPELVDDRRDRLLVCATEEEAGVEDDDLGAAGGGDPRAPVERADRGRELAAACLEVPHEPEQRCVDRERDVVLARLLPELLGPGVIHPESALEVDLAGVVAALEQ